MLIPISNALFNQHPLTSKASTVSSQSSAPSPSRSLQYLACHCWCHFLYTSILHIVSAIEKFLSRHPLISCLPHCSSYFLPITTSPLTSTSLPSGYGHSHGNQDGPLQCESLHGNLEDFLKLEDYNPDLWLRFCRYLPVVYSRPWFPFPWVPKQLLSCSTYLEHFSFPYHLPWCWHTV